MLYRIIIVVILITLLLSSFSCKKAPKELIPITVTLDWTPNTNHTGLYVALEQGLYGKEGLEVQIVQPGQGYTDQIVASGKSQFGVSYQENVTRARYEGLPLVSIAAIMQHNLSGFASLKSADIKSPKDFENKRYGSWDSPSEMAVLKAVTAKANADISKIKVVSGITDFFSTIGRDADFEWIYEYWDGVEAGLRGMELNMIYLKDLDPALDYYTPVIISNDNLIKTNPKIVKGFLKATAKGYDYAIKNPQNAAQILLKHAPELKPELVFASQSFLVDKYQAESPKWGLQKREVWQRFANWMLENRLIDRQLNIDAAFTNEFLPDK